MTIPYPKLLTPMALGAMFLALQLGFVTTVSGAPATKNPAGKIYVADLEGQAQINTGEKIEAPTKGSAYKATSTIIETSPKSTLALVFSNSTGLLCDEQTKLEIGRFSQEPFMPNRNDLEVEPSISQTVANVASGTVGLCTSKLVAGSSMSYTTAQAMLNIRGGKLTIEAGEGRTKISVFEGDITVRGGELDASGVVLKSGQQAIVTPGAPGQPNVIVVQDIPEAERPPLDQKASLACMARRTVFFDTGDQGEILATPVTPANPPADFTVSPARIP